MAAGDMILEVDGINVSAGLTILQVAEMIRRNHLSPKFVTLVIWRSSATPGSEKVMLDFQLTMYGHTLTQPR